MAKKFTICVLLYGDHEHLAFRCLRSIVHTVPTAQYELRIGMNEVGNGTLTLVSDFIRGWRIAPEHVYQSDVNIGKYPLMRRMFHDTDAPLTTPYTMWFDDDTFLREGHPDWLATLELAMQAMPEKCMIGSTYTQKLRGNQAAWIKAQPWWNGKPVPPTHTVKFVTGGWWCINTDLLETYDWPSPQLIHNGGDVMLGELCRQQDIPLRLFRTGVAINADEAGNECAAPRRGADTLPIGVNFDGGVADRVAEATIAPPIRRKPLLDL